MTIEELKEWFAARYPGMPVDGDQNVWFLNPDYYNFSLTGWKMRGKHPMAQAQRDIGGGQVMGKNKASKLRMLAVQYDYSASNYWDSSKELEAFLEANTIRNARHERSFNLDVTPERLREFDCVADSWEYQK